VDEKAKQMMELSTEVNQLNEDRWVKIYSLFLRSGLGKSVLFTPHSAYSSAAINANPECMVRSFYLEPNPFERHTI